MPLETIPFFSRSCCNSPRSAYFRGRASQTGDDHRTTACPIRRRGRQYKADRYCPKHNAFSNRLSCLDGEFTTEPPNSQSKEQGEVNPARKIVVSEGSCQEWDPPSPSDSTELAEVLRARLALWD